MDKEAMKKYGKFEHSENLSKTDIKCPKCQSNIYIDDRELDEWLICKKCKITFNPIIPIKSWANYDWEKHG